MPMSAPALHCPKVKALLKQDKPDPNAVGMKILKDVLNSSHEQAMTLQAAKEGAWYAEGICFLSMCSGVSIPSTIVPIYFNPSCMIDIPCLNCPSWYIFI